MKSWVNALFQSLAVLAILAVTVPLMAAQVQYTGVTPGETERVRIEYPAGSLLYEGEVLVGMYNFTITGDPLFNGSFRGYCVDPAFSEQGPYGAGIVPVLDDSRYEAAAFLLGKYYGNTSADNAWAAKVQLAVLELVYDHGNYDLSRGAFQYDGEYGSAVTDLVDEAADALGTFLPAGFYVTQAPDTGESYGARPQDFIFHRVSEPVTPVLLCTGMLVLALSSRRGWRSSPRRG
jgi:hypothetical protein